jgi:signal transduction histidine kinase
MQLQLESLELGLNSSETVMPALQRNLDRMQRVLEALLSLARAGETNHEPVALNLLLKETLQLLPAAMQQRVSIKSSLADDVKIPQPYLMGQCLLNLVDNALKYSRDDVLVTIDKQAESVHICVLDQGEGVPDELLEKLTHRFFRLSKHVEGSGLGLSFVKHTVKTFNGELKLRNTARGFEVSLILPVARA